MHLDLIVHTRSSEKECDCSNTLQFHLAFTLMSIVF